MTLLHHLLATAVPLVSGFGFLSLLGRPGIGLRRVGEQVGLSYLAGMVIIASEMWVLGRLGVTLSLFTILLLQCVPLALLGVRLVRRRSSGLFPASLLPRVVLPKKGWQWLLVALIASKLLYVLVMNLNGLLRPNDAFRVALVLARYTFFEGNYTGFALPEGYPALPGLMLAWFGLAGKGWNEFAINLAHFNYYAVFLLLFHANLRACAGVSGGLIGAYLLSAFPLVLVHAALVGYADLPMAIFLTFSLAYAYRYAKGGRGDDLALAAFFVLCLPAIKLEGTVPYFPIALYALGAAVCHRREWVKPRVLWALAACVLTAGFALLWFLHARYGVTGPPWLAGVWGNILPGNRWALIAAPLRDHFGHTYHQWMLIGTVIAFAVPVLSIRFAGRPEYVLGLGAVLLLVSFVYLYGVGGAYLWLVNGTVVNRSYLQIMPALLFTAIVMIDLFLRRPAQPTPPAPSSLPPTRS